MHHLYPLAKGDPLCPLGFHPQVRWPTRCKRCFRDYKEHGGKKRDSDSSLRRDDTTASTPSLSWNYRDSDGEKKRNWVSSSNLACDRENNTSNKSESNSTNPSSWTSTPDLANLEDDTQAVTTVSLKLPKRKKKPIDTGQRTVSDSFSIIKEKPTPVFNREDTLAARARKLKAIKECSQERVKRIQIKEVKTISEESTNHDVQFLIQVKAKPKAVEETHEDLSENDEDSLSTAGTETTDTTLVDGHDSELKDQLQSLKKELEVTKSKCDRLEREKSDILLRRLAAMETTTSKTTATEVLKLQQKCNELQQTLEDYKDEKRSLSLKVKELEEDLETRPTAQSAQKLAEELRSKLLAAETLCEELMDENEDIKKELRDMEEQMDELQDNFREDQAVEYTSLKKELDQTTKNCRILSFKLRKAERKSEQLEQEKTNVEKKLKEVNGGQSALASLEKVKHLEQELKVSTEVSIRLQKQLEEANEKLSKASESTKAPPKKKGPMLGTIGKVPSTDGKVSRDSLTRGGSQDDPAQLLRDLQDSLEREADLREQLKFAEEEAQNLHKKVSRIEDDNESLVLQLKKMANKARSRKLSPTNNSRLTPEPQAEKGNVSDDEDPAEVKLQLELSEQEASVLRRKVEDLEADNRRIKTKNKELQEKVTSKIVTKKTPTSNDKGNSIQNQKLKVLEDETNDLRKKLIEKERDCERLHAELSLNQKRSKVVQKSKSLDLDQQTLDLKRQLQIVEQEAAILRTKVQSLENENEKLISENKRLQLLRGTKSYKTDKNIDKLIDQIASLEVDLAEADKKIKSLEQNKIPNEIKTGVQYKQYFNRTPKKVSNFTSKDQLKIMVTDLENEIGEMIVAIKTTENERIKLEEELKNFKNTNNSKKTYKDLEDKIEKIENELFKEKEKNSDEQIKNEGLRQSLNEAEDILKKNEKEKDKLKNQIENLNENLKTVENEKDELNERIMKLNTDLKGTKDKELRSLKKELETKIQTINELKTKCSKLTELENNIIETEEKLRSVEKQNKDKIKTYEMRIEDMLLEIRTKDSEKSKLNNKVEEIEKKFNAQIDDLSYKIATMETTIEHKKRVIEQLEENLKKEKEKILEANSKAGEKQSKEMNKLKEELSKNKSILSELESKLELSQKDNKNLEYKLKTSESNIKNNKIDSEKKISDLEVELQNENKKLETIKMNYEKENKNKDLQLSTLKDKIKSLEMNNGTNKKSSELNQLQDKINKIQMDLSKEKQKYNDLTSKYELLEEEHVVTKAKLVMEKETLESQYSTVKQDLQESESSLITLRETYNKKENTWTKEKLDLQEKIKNMDKRTLNGGDFEKNRLRASLEEKQSELDNVKKENEVINDQMEYMRKECDELKKKLDDYQKVNKIQRNISADSSAMEKEIRQLKTRLTATEKSKKTDLAEYKMRYDSQLSLVNKELQSLQSQVMRFKRERDTYKHMLESAQKTISELKNSPKTRKDSLGSVHYDELEESISKVAALEQQISCMEDELSEARLEGSKLKTELVSERSCWEVKISELHSRINELEEEKILNSGRTKIVGLRTRMELAWQKEREEQQRLLQETATLARDLRQTLFEVERERDKERLESKRKQDQFKKTSEEDQDENKKKINELQCDLLELRDAHAKLRTTNEKLRREKERYEREREEMRLAINGKKRYDREDDKKINSLLQNIYTLKQVAPELFLQSNNDSNYTPTPPRRIRSSKSRENSPMYEKRENSVQPEDKQLQIQYIMQRLVNTSEELKHYQKGIDDGYETERIRRSMGIRRATSTEHENVSESIKNRGLYSRQNNILGSLHRKSLSLEHNIQNEQKIWKNENDSLTSLQSLDTSLDVDAWKKRDTSLDSRLSGGSTQSDFTGGEVKKKKGIIGKLKKLTKSRSIDDKDPGTFSPTRALSSKPNSNSDINEESKGSKSNLKDIITGIFKKGGSSSRSNSVERQKTEARHDTSSTQRPLVRNDSNGNISRSSPMNRKY